eukprot:scaffold10585_cov32-Tisochrysis_lutea.AAC.2
MAARTVHEAQRLLMDLRGQLARRREHEASRLGAAVSTLKAVAIQSGHDVVKAGEEESPRFAGARLCTCH